MRSAMEWLRDQSDVGDLVLFLDFDGTLAPIVDRPGQARPLDGIADLVEKIGDHIPVAIISGRGLDDVTDRLGARGIYYAGSHGMEIQSPDGQRHESQQLTDIIPELDAQEGRLRKRFEDDSNIEIERKRFGVAVHYRRQPEARSVVEAALREAVDATEGLKVGTGKMVRELQPDVDDDKGTALAYIRRRIDSEHRRRPVYIGDDVTDEDAFEAIADDGLGVLVSKAGRETAARLRLDDPHQVRQWLQELEKRAATEDPG